MAGTGNKTFTGNLTIDPGGVYNETGLATVITNAGSLTNNGTYIANTTPHTFSGAAKAIGGNNLISIPTATFSGTYTNSGALTGTTFTVTGNFTNSGAMTVGTLTVTGGAIRITNNGTLTTTTALSGTGGVTQGANATLNIGGTSGIITLTAAAAGNVVNYDGAAQTVKAVPYYDLILSGSGAETMATGITINAAGNLSIAPTGTATATLSNNLTDAGTLTLGGVGQVGGGTTYGGTGSGAVHINPTYFNPTANLKLTVTTTDALPTPTINFGPPPTPNYLGGNFTVSATTTNTDSSTLIYSVVSGPCALVSGAMFSSTGPGTCVVQAYGPATAHFGAASATQSIPIGLASQATLTVSASPAIVVQGDSTTLSSSGGSGTGTVTYSVGSSTGCTLSGNVVTVTDASGTCNVTATKAADTNYQAATSAPLAITMALYQAEINKQFLPTNIAPSGTSILSITLFNPNSFQLINAAWNDNLAGVQPGISIVSPATVTNDPLAGGCGGTVNAVGNGTTISLSGGTIPAKVGSTNGQCTVTVVVTSTTQGNLINTILSGAVTAKDAGGDLASNTTPASATLQVSTILAPTVDKSFNAATVFAGVPSQMTIDINNQDASNALTNVGLTDNLPANVVIANSPSPSVSGAGCTANLTNLTASAGASSLTFSGAKIAAGTTNKCTIKVNVVSMVQGSYVNFIPAGAVQTAQGVTNALPAQATLNVQQLNIAKTISPNSTGAGNISLVTITINKPTGIAYTGMGLTDTLPTAPVNMLVSGSVPISNSCGGSITAFTTGTPNTVMLSGGSMIASATSCSFTFNVTTPIGSGAQTIPNTILAGSLTDDQGVSNPNSVTANLTTTDALTATKAIAPSPVTSGSDSTVTITLTNNNNSTMTGVSVTDPLPTNLVVDGTPPLSNNCGGTVNYNSPSNTLTLTGGTITHNSNCTFTFHVTSTVPAVYTNTIPLANICATGPSAVCATGAAPSANLTVQAGALPLTGSKAFSVTNIAPGGTSVLTINIKAPSDTIVHNVSITDNLPVGMTTTTAVAKNAACQGGTLSPGTGLSTIIYTGGTIAASATCTLTATVTSSTPGFATNDISTTQVTDTDGRSLQADLTASLNVSNFTMSKAFYPPSVNQNGFSRLVITLDNQNLTALTTLNLNNSLPAGMIVASAPNYYAFTDCGGTFNPAGGSGTLTLAGGGVPAKVNGVDGICTIQVNVKATAAPGTLTNTVRVNPEDVSAYLGTSLVYPLAAASANLVVAPLTILVNKSFPSPATVFGGSAEPMNIILTNPNNADLTGIQFIDDMTEAPGPVGVPGSQTGMFIANPPNVTYGNPSLGYAPCSGTLTAVAGGTSFSYSGGVESPSSPTLKLPANSSCSMSVDITMNVNGNLTNTIFAGGVTTLNGVSNTQPATATLTNLGGVSINKSFSPNPISLASGSYSKLTLQIVNQSNFPLTNVGGSLGSNAIDILPSGLTIADWATSFTPTNTCGGGTNFIAAAGTNTIYLSTGNVAANGTCTITVPVTADVSQTPGCYTNTIPVNAMTDDQGQQNTEIAQDTLCILGNPTITTTPNPSSGTVGVRLQDTASLSGGISPTGTVKFSLFDPNDSTCSGTAIYTETSNVSGSFTAATSTGFATNEVGTWHWQAHYSGDSQNSSSDSACSAEPVVTNQASPSITTSAITTTASVGVNIPIVGDSVTSMGGAYNPTGSVTFTLYSDATCSTAVPGMSGSGNLLGGVAHWSTSWMPTAGGIYYWIASYPGDANNASFTTTCGDPNEQITIQSAALGDFVWNDVNANGIQDTGETGINGVTVTLYGSDGTTVIGTPTTTAPDGSYHFTNLAPGTYYVGFTAPSGYMFSPQYATGSTTSNDSNANPTTGMTDAITLTAGETDDTIDAGMYKPVTIGDFVWNDVNANGIQDTGEAGIKGVTLTLNGTNSSGGTVTDTATTDVNGKYLFTEAPGTYTVTVDASNFSGTGALVGYNVSPTLVGSDRTIDSNINPSGTTPSALLSGSDLTVDFGYYKPVTIGDFVWNDVNANGIQDTGEAGIKGVTLTLNGTNSSGGTVTDTATTDVNGKYLFTEAPGTYTVTVDASNFSGTGALVGYNVSPTLVGSDRTIDSNINPSGTTPSALLSGSDLTVDFGYYKPVTIGDFVWNDVNANGIQDTGEAGIKGVTLTLNGTNSSGGTVTDTATTDVNGKYLFTEAPGTYTVTVDASNFSGTGALVGYNVSPTLVGSDRTIDSNVNPSGTTPSALLSGSDLTVDFGYYKPVTIGDFVWNDVNANGIQDTGEAGIKGVTLTLNGTNSSGGTVTDTATTDVNGKYLFTEAPGTYTVTVDASNFSGTGALVGYNVSPTLVGSDRTIDSNINPSGTTPSALLSGSDLTVDFGYYKPVTIGDFVWNDVNANGIQDTGEAGIKGVTLTLNGTNSSGGTVTDTATTDVNGKYLFTEAPGTYTVTVDASNFSGTGALVGYNVSPTLVGSDRTIDSNINPSGTTPSALLSGSDLTVDFGYYKPVTIGDFVWNDVNANGIQDTGEAGIKGVTLTLNGTNSSGGTVTDTATTDVNGKYLFTEAPGTYTVTVDASNFSGTGALVGYNVSPTLVGSDRTIDSNINPSGTTPSALLSGSDLTVDFGYYKPVTIGDFVWNDVNANGIQDTGEAGIKGVTLTLNGTNSSGGTVTDTATTDVNGKYLFTEAPGTYTVTVDASNFSGTGALVGYNVSPTLVGSDRTVDSNVNPSGTTPSALLSGSDLTVDFGYYKPVTIGDYCMERCECERHPGYG